MREVSATSPLFKKNKSLQYASSGNKYEQHTFLYEYLNFTILFQHFMSYVGLPDTKTHWISSLLQLSPQERCRNIRLPSICPDKTLKTLQLLNTKDKNVFWKTGKSVWLGLHAMYSTYEIQYFTPGLQCTEKCVTRFLLKLYCCIGKLHLRRMSNALHNLKAFVSGNSQIPGHSYA
jgi:hypothetical protein